MTIKEFIQKYHLHDSLLEKIEYQEEKGVVKIEVDFCYWQQENFQEDMPETGLVVVEFQNVTEFQYEPHQINSDEIVEVSCPDEQTIEFVVFHDLSEKYRKIVISAGKVFLRENKYKRTIAEK